MKLLDWEESARAGAAVVGGKGWNLGRLATLGFPVPAGAVIPAQAYRDHVRGLEGDATAILARPIDPHLKALLRPWEERDLAVRSSATLEDSLRYSFAGVHQSRLRVRGGPALEEAVKVCWASLWSEPARSYRAHHGLADDDVAGAVVLCDMVSARVAGVGFTIDPVTGQRDRLVVEGVDGLAEDLVQGRVTPWTARILRGRLDYRVEQEGLFPELPRLARLLDRVYWALGDGEQAQDVEWVYDGAQFWLVQARPVTAAPRFTYPALRDQPVIWSCANMNDSLPGVVSTLSWSLIVQTVEQVLYAAARSSGYSVPPGLEVVRRFQGRGYFDFSAMQWAFYDSLGVPPHQIVSQLGGAHPCITVPGGSPFWGKDGWRRLLRFGRLVRRLWSMDLPGALRQHREGLWELDRRLQDLERLNLAELAQVVLDSAELLVKLEPQVGLANATVSAWFDTLSQSLARLMGEEAPALLNRLLAGTGQVTSAEHGYRIYELACQALAEPAARQALSAEDPWSEVLKLPSTSSFRREAQRFLEDFGHRCIYEADVANPRWAEAPEAWLAQVRHWCDQGDLTESPRQRAERLRLQAEARLRQEARWRYPWFGWLLKKVRWALALREEAKSEIVRAALSSRRLLLELGRRLLAAGHCTAPEQIFDLCSADLMALLTGEWDGAGSGRLADMRRAQRLEWLQQSPPDVIVEGAGPAPPLVPALPPTGAWQGLGVAAGRAEGVARVLRHPEQGHRLRQGEILVAPTTDPGWTPIFLRAGAIVMESGGYLSHGAIVAREYGIPAVVNLPGLLEAVQDGCRLQVDGERGQVVRVA